MLSQELTIKARNRGVRRVVSISGIESVYFEYQAKNPNAPVIVMIHGYRGNHHGLEAIAGALDDFRVLIPDLPGFGESEQLPFIHSLDAYANWLGAFLQDLGLVGKATIVGHSFGSLVVGRYAMTADCKSIVLINPVSAPALSGPRALLTRITSSFYHFTDMLPKSLGGWLLRSPVAVMVMSSVMAKTTDRKLRNWIHKQHLSNFSDFASVRVAIEGYEASISSNLSEMAESIRCPALIIAADMDDITAIHKQIEVSKLYPMAQLVSIQGVGHLVHYEAPQQAASHIARFVEDSK